MILGIDASNIRGGGGVTHLLELLKSANPNQYGFEKVILWSGKLTLDRIENRDWLIKVEEPMLNKSLIHRVFWQKFILDKKAKENNCSLLFIPGSSYSGKFKPFATLSQNLLPFEIKEMMRYGISWQIIRLILLRIIQSSTFKNADGVIFLTNYARDCILKVIRKNKGLTAIIPHGINFEFESPVKEQKSIDKYSQDKPYKILYVSMIDRYKHQEVVSEAIVYLVQKGYPIQLDLVGPAYSPAFKTLEKKWKQLEVRKKNYPIYYHGSVDYKNLKNWYKESDLFLFASSCENMPIILMEAMVAGLPIASSNLGPMPEVLQKNGVYFNPKDSMSIANSIESMIQSKELRQSLAMGSFNSIKKYSWKKCADETFHFFQQVILTQKRK